MTISKSDGVIEVVMTRLLPSIVQELLLVNYISTGRATYNCTLYQLKAGLNQRAAEKASGVADGSLTPGVPWDPKWLDTYVTEHKREWFSEFYDQVPAGVYTSAAKNMGKALTNFNAGRAKFPTFKKKRGEGALDVAVTLKDTKTDWIKPDGKHVHLPITLPRRKRLMEEGHDWRAASAIAVVKDRRFQRATKLVSRGDAQVQEVTYSHSGGYWWASIRLRVKTKHQLQVHQKSHAPERLEVLGLDIAMGDTFCVLSRPIPGLSDAQGRIPAPHYLKKSLAQLAVAQRILQLKEEGSKRYFKALKDVQRLHGKVAQQRKTWQENLVIELTRHTEVLVIEDLNIKGMTKRKKVKPKAVVPGTKPAASPVRNTRPFSYGKSVSDSAPAQFLEICRYQGARRGTLVVDAPRFYPSSKTCSGCKAVKTKLPVWVRTYTCEACGLVIDRDANAALNLEGYGRDVVEALLNDPCGVGDARDVRVHAPLVNRSRTAALLRRSYAQACALTSSS